MDEADIGSTIYEFEMDFIRAIFCRDKDRLAARLSDDFVEFGQSGGRADKQGIVDGLSRMSEDRKIVLSDFRVRRLSDGVFLAIYRAEEENGRVSNRSSIWEKCAGHEQWKIVFHQGTTAADHHHTTEEKNGDRNS